MQNPLPEGAPWWAVLFAYCLFFGLALMAALKGWRGADKPSDARNAVIAGDIMDTKPVKDLAAQVMLLAVFAEKIVEGQKRVIEAQDRTTEAVDRASAATDRNEAAVRAMCAAYERSKK